MLYGVPVNSLLLVWLDSWWCYRDASALGWSLRACVAVEIILRTWRGWRLAYCYGHSWQCLFQGEGSDFILFVM